MRDIQCHFARSLLLLCLLHLHLQNLHHALRVILFPLNRLLQRVKIALDECRFGVIVRNRLGLCLVVSKLLLHSASSLYSCGMMRIDGPF